MKLLVVGHTYITSYAQQKYVEMKRLSPDMELKILTPRKINGLFRTYEREIASGLTATEVMNVRDLWLGSHMSYVFDPWCLARVLKHFQPDRVHIEEDPYSAVGIETVFLARIFSPSAKLSFFIWDNIWRMPGFPLNIIKKIMNKYSLDKADLVVCGNREGELILREKKDYKGVVAVMPQIGLSPHLYDGVRKNKLKNTINNVTAVPVIGFAGRLIPEKGIIQLLEALEPLVNTSWNLVLLGSGPLGGEIHDKWQNKYGDRLILRAAVPHAEVGSYLRELDIFVLPSCTTAKWKEQFGLVLAEAMLSGVACIGSSSGAIPDVIGPGGLIFKENDIKGLTLLLKSLIDDPELRQSLGAKGKQFAEERYTHCAVAKGYLNIFTKASPKVCNSADKTLKG
jgi:glycosyltransferase involved in cell wall biosynthesis